MKLATSGICSAFQPNAIGSKVIYHRDFKTALKAAIEAYNTATDRVKGQHFIVLGPEAYPLVCAGDGPVSKNTSDYIIRSHREGPKMYMRRECAGETNFLAAVVYTREAYLNDPDTKEESVVFPEDVTHILVAVIASSGPAAPLTPYRFVHNLAGGNHEAETWSRDEIVAKAKAIKAYWDTYSVVAD